jgi:hypothetical protein
MHQVVGGGRSGKVHILEWRMVISSKSSTPHSIRLWQTARGSQGVAAVQHIR